MSKTFWDMKQSAMSSWDTFESHRRHLQAKVDACEPVQVIRMRIWCDFTLFWKKSWPFRHSDDLNEFMHIHFVLQLMLVAERWVSAIFHKFFELQGLPESILDAFWSKWKFFEKMIFSKILTLKILKNWIFFIFWCKYVS